MAHYSAFKSFVFMIFVLYLAEQLPGSHGKGFFGLKLPWKKSKAREHDVTGKGKDLPMEPGDTIISGFKPNSRWLIRPWRWHYAISSDELVSFYPKSIITKGFSGTQAKIVNIKTSKFKNVKLKNRKKKAGHIGDVGVLVAYLMTQYDKDLPFNAVRCYGKHYVDYLSQGLTAGSWRKITYLRATKKCPVYNRLQSNMFDTIYAERKFTLTDNSKPTKYYHLFTNDWPDSIKALKKRRDSHSHSIKT